MPTSKPTRKRTAEHLHKAKKPKRFKKQKNYHSSSESDDDEDDVPDFAPISMEGSSDEIETTPVVLPSHIPADRNDQDSSDDDSAGEDENLDALIERNEELDLDDATDSDVSTQGGSKKRKRNDPSAFANSMSKILSSKLSVSKRADPVLARSAVASSAQKEMADSRLEAQAKQRLRAEKKAALEQGRVKDVLGLDTDGVSAAEVQERERRLKKTAQRGVVKLFNAVRAAQVQADTARDQARRDGVVGMGQREQRINEMSKQGFLDLIAKGGKKNVPIEEG